MSQILHSIEASLLVVLLTLDLREERLLLPELSWALVARVARAVVISKTFGVSRLFRFALESARTRLLLD